MSWVRHLGSDVFIPLSDGYPWAGFASMDLSALLLDADEEELQIIGHVVIEGGGTKTFGTSGSEIHWLPGSSITFASGSTLRVGVKQASSIDTGSGPPARATIGAAAFDVYDDLVGGTDTITASTHREDAMSAGTPFSVTHGDLLAVCFHLDTSSGTPAVRIAGYGPGVAINRAGTTLVTSGPTYSGQFRHPAIAIRFDDGSIGCIYPYRPLILTNGLLNPIGNGNIAGNLINLPFACRVDGVLATHFPSVSGVDTTFGIWSDPFGTPVLEKSVSVLGEQQQAQIQRCYAFFGSDFEMRPNTDYVVGIRQDTASGNRSTYHEVGNADHWAVWDAGANCYAVTSTGGAAFSSYGSNKRRFHTSLHIAEMWVGGPGSQGFVGIGMGG